MKEKIMANLAQYRAVLDDLMKQRSQLSFRIGEIDSAVSALSRLMPIEESTAPVDSQQSLPIVVSGRYAGMSTRWAILALLTEDANGPMQTGQIAESLRNGGMQSNAQSFAGNVSAVLSKMNHEHGEVAAGQSGWVITEKGRDAWIHIKGSRDRKVSPPSSPQPHSAQAEVSSAIVQ